MVVVVAVVVVVVEQKQGYGRNNVFRRRHFYRAIHPRTLDLPARSHPPPIHIQPEAFVVSNALCELHCKISLYSCAMRPLYPVPETFAPGPRGGWGGGGGGGGGGRIKIGGKRGMGGGGKGKIVNE